MSEACCESFYVAMVAFKGARDLFYMGTASQICRNPIEETIGAIVAMDDGVENSVLWNGAACKCPAINTGRWCHFNYNVSTDCSTLDLLEGCNWAIFCRMEVIFA